MKQEAFITKFLSTKCVGWNSERRVSFYAGRAEYSDGTVRNVYSSMAWAEPGCYQPLGEWSDAKPFGWIENAPTA